MKIAMFWAAVPALVCAMAQAQANGANPLASSRVFLYEDMPVRTASNGAEGRVVFTGTLRTGEAVGSHETTQPAGAKPPSLHVIQHSEFIVVQEGTLEFNHDGKAERVGPGGIIYVALGTSHFVKNVGDGPAKYVVIQVGGDTKR
jgi:mannose-6-phosphate isomerase-like protein (cupin superfamily)